ncbi:sugar transporter [Sulfitobacter sp. SK012]|uniref:sugar transporter n=1 Tax=Sulfitobacter sp. SK012 TaxID=1389005 RepID=UPI000E0AD0A9|nr:sugar transporter [Sulfitobacter sp. SK012]AXI48015.1 sugar transporter [Sulfitobacter sp. SK012]
MPEDNTAPRPTPQSPQEAAAEAARAPAAPAVPATHRTGTQPVVQSVRQPAVRKKPPPGGQVPTVNIRPLAVPATMRKRHWKLLASFLGLVVIPLTLVILYLSIYAEDQYASTTGFTVRQDEGGGASELLGGLSAIVGGSSGGADSEILYEFIQSQEMVNIVQDRLDVRGHYAQNWPNDWVFAIWPDATAEDMKWYWQRIVRISLDSSSGLMEVRVLAYDPQLAQDIAKEIVRESQDRINSLNAQARDDAMSYAISDLNLAVDRLKQAREDLTRFRTRTQIVDPAADIQGRMGVMNNLQQQLAESLIEYDLLLETTKSSDPRIVQALRRTQVIRERISSERDTFSSDDTANGGVGEDYPSLIAEFESLSVDREFAEQTYGAALAALDLARNNAQRQSMYLATYIQPTLAQTSEYPSRWGLVAMAAFFLLLSWAIMALIFYSLRDRN